MTYLANRDYNLEVLRGNVSGHTMVVIEGHDDVLDTTKTTLSPTLTTANINQSAIDKDATPAAVGIASTDNTNDNSGGTGALTCTIIGLDASGDAQSVTETMNGTTAVTTGETWSAINGIEVATTGSNNANTGTIWVGTGTFTAGVPAVRMASMHIGYNKAMTAYYTVPTGKTLYMRHLTTQLGSANKDVEIFIEQAVDGLNWFIDFVYELESGAEFQSPILGEPGLAAGTHIRIEAQSSAASTKITAILSCELVDN